MNQFRKNHLKTILENFSKTNAALDIYLSNYFRANKCIGSKDRIFLGNATYGIIRWQGLLDHFLLTPISWESKIEAYLGFDPIENLTNLRLPSHIRVSFPKNFYELLVDDLGEEKAFQFCLASNFPAPTTIRVNPLKTQRDVLLEQWKPIYEVSATTTSPLGIRFHRKQNFYLFQEFRRGYFEVQDEASQLVANMVGAKPGDHVLDYCAGSGGKTLGFAHKLSGKGQIYLHDVRPHVLVEARKRLIRAGIQNAQIVSFDQRKNGSLKNKMDWVLLDVPCSGSGTLRRNPDRKWKFSTEQLLQFTQLQRTIFHEAIQYVKPGGNIVYSTCSVLRQENDDQLAYFQKKFGVLEPSPPFRSFTTQDGMDGFFGVILQKPV